MNYEFDPTLTPGVQNRYAEGMDGESRAEYAPSGEDEETKEKSSEESTAQNKDQSSKESFFQQRKKRMEEFRSVEQELLRHSRYEQELSLEEMRRSGRLSDEAYNYFRKNLLNLEGQSGLNRLDKAQSILNVGLEREGNIEQQMLLKEQAFQELQDIAKSFLQNSKAKIHLTSEEQRVIHQLAEADPKNLSLDRMSELVRQASRRDLLKDLYADNFLANGGEEEPVSASSESREQREAMLDQYYPPSAEDLAEQLTMMEGPEWQTGGEKEIIMADGTIHWGHLLDWARERWLHWGHQFSPDNPQESAFKTVGFLSGYSFIDLQSWVMQDRYWRKKVPKRDEEGNPIIDKKTGKVVYETSATGRIKYETSSEYQNFRMAFLNEMWRFSNAHQHDVAVRLARGNEEKMLEALGQVMSQTIWMKDKDGMLAMWKLSASNEVIKEGPNKGMFEWMLTEGSNGPIEEGNLGRAHRQADFLYYKMAHIENVDAKNIHKINLFHEILGEKGRLEFYRAMVQRRLTNLYGSQDEVKTVMNRIKGSGMEGIDLTEVMFCRNTSDLEALFTKQTNIKDDVLEKFLNRDKMQAERVYKKINPEKFQKRKEEFLRSLMQDSLNMRMKVLERLTGMDENGRKIVNQAGRIAFRSKEVWDIFNSMRPANAEQNNTTLAQIKGGRNWEKMHLLGLRFMDEIVPPPHGSQGEKWNSAPNKAAVEVQRSLNLFKRGYNSTPWLATVRGAVQDAVGEVNDLPGFDAEYAENFAYAKVYFMLSSGLNDTTATGTDASTKLLQFFGYRLNNTDTGFGKNYVGNIQNLYGIKRLLLTPWEGLYGEETDAVTGKKKKYSLAKILEQGFTEATRGQKMKEIDTALGVETTYASNHVSSSLKLYKRIMAGPIFDFEKWVKIDIYNRVSIDPKAMNEAMNGINKDVRYTYNQIGIDFEEEDDTFEIDFVRKPGDLTYSGALSFGKQKMKDKLFGEEVINMGMYDRRIMEGRWANKIIGQKDRHGEEMLSEYSRNIVGYLIAKDILEHRLYDPQSSMYNSSIWGKTMVNAVEGMFASIPIEIEKSTIGLFNKHMKIKKKDSFFNRKEFDKIRKLANAGRFQLFAEDVRAQVAESGWKGGQGVTKKFFSYIFQDIWSFK